MDATNTEDDSWQFRTEEEQQLAEAVLAKAMAAVESGQNPEEVLASANLPENVKQKLRRKLKQALQEKAARAPQATTQEVATKRFSMSGILNLIPKQTLEKIQAIFAKNPQLANQVKELGAKLAMNGVSPDLDFKPGQSISAPTVGVGKSQQQQR